MSRNLKNITQCLDKNTEKPILKRRLGFINTFIELGPGDLVVINWNKENSIKLTANSGKKTTFFNVYGVDCSSPASIGAYVNSIINESGKPGWMGSSKITAVTYCLFDFMHNYDAHLEFKFPGSLTVKVYDVNNERVRFESVQWEFFYVSSMLRNFQPRLQPVTKFYPFLETPTSLLEFMDSALRLFALKPEKSDKKKQNMNQILFTKDSCTPDFIGSRGNFIANQICHFLVETSRLEIGLEFFYRISQSDSRYSVFLLEILSRWTPKLKLNKIMAEMIRNSSYSRALLFKEAEILTERKSHETAIQLLKTVLQLAPNSLDVWVLLVENYIEKNDFINALYALNAIPVSVSSISFEDETNNKVDEEVPKGCLVQPKVNDHISSSNRYNVIPESFDFQFTLVEKEIAFLHSGMVEDSELLFKKYHDLPNHKMSTRMFKVFRKLSKIENLIGWQLLLKVRSQLFRGNGSGKADTNSYESDDGDIEEEENLLSPESELTESPESKKLDKKHTIELEFDSNSQGSGNSPIKEV